jgi:hypothetical protein
MEPDDTACRRPPLRQWPLPAKVLATSALAALALGMAGALGQVLVHDVIPTFYPGASAAHAAHGASAPAAEERGDLFGTAPAEPARPFYETGEFQWLLKWTHVHLFGMSMIFIFLGGVTACLELKPQARAWLIALPFLGVLTDVASMWLKTYVSPHFFWLHLPGGGLFTGVFFSVSARALYELWAQRGPTPGRAGGRM